MSKPPPSQMLSDVEKQDLVSKQLGRKPFWSKRYTLKEEGGLIYEAEFRAYHLGANKEAQDIRLEKRALVNNRPQEMQVIHLKEADLKGILMMFGESLNG